MTTTKQIDLWGSEVDIFVPLLAKYGIPPATVWDVNRNGAGVQEALRLIGDLGQTRPSADAARLHDTTPGLRRKEGTEASVFNPLIAYWALKLYAPEPPAVVLDPFAGGGTRAIVAAKMGYRYMGVELREAEARATQARIEAAGCGGLAKIVIGDAQRLPYPDANADFCLTCPPYWYLEPYYGGPDDLSMAPNLDAYQSMLSYCVDEIRRVLKSGALAFVVIGLIRHPDNPKCILPLNHLLASTMRSWYFTLKEEIILVNQVGFARVANFEKGSHLLARVHEYGHVYINERGGK